MRRLTPPTKFTAAILAVALLAAYSARPALAQDQAPPPPQAEAPPPPPDQGPPPPSYSPDQLDQMVSRIALYPDPLLAQVLAAATFPDQIPDAARWADDHHYLRGQDLASAITADHLWWDPSVQALLPFPSVLAMMASDMDWTTNLGDAFLAQRQDVMDAVQRMRQKAKDYGYLRSNDQIVVSGGPYIEIDPVDPAFICVPVYNPLIVFAPPRPGFFVGGAIAFGFGIDIGVAFRPWGWGVVRFDWGRHALFINNVPWGRRWDNRRVYVHPYPEVHRWARGNRVEGHRLIRRSPAERRAPREGRPRPEERHHR
ncbi:MAG: DUF3300 domain-containing protein [Candidatus Sulfotelmatobacter sp.]